VKELKREIEAKDATAAALAEGINTEYLAKNRGTSTSPQPGLDFPQVASTARKRRNRGLVDNSQQPSQGAKEEQAVESPAKPREGQALRYLANLMGLLVTKLPRPWGK
jgi:hypothetical protein